MAARELAKAGKKVTILEARSRTGGRIHTLDNASFFKHAELGAEFVHGDLPVTLKLLKQAGIDLMPSSGEMWTYDNDKFSKGYQQTEHWKLLIKKLGQLRQDTSIGDFLRTEFDKDRYAALRNSVHKFVAGYDTADPFKASSFALTNEWQSDNEDAQHRVKGGYCRMITYLANEAKNSGARLFLNSIVKQINWGDNSVEAITTNSVNYRAEKVIIALPLGVLQAQSGEQGAIAFSPAIPKYQQAFQQIGFGAIIKVLLQFKDAFWERKEATRIAGESLKQMSFLLSDQQIPTWWTQYPNHLPVLTGWLGGPPAEKKKNLPNEQLLRQSLQSLSNIFKLSILELKNELIAWNVVNWTTDPFTRGSYAYDTVESSKGREILTDRGSQTICFAGEYLYDGPAMGTVEAALTSGMLAAGSLTG